MLFRSLFLQGGSRVKVHKEKALKDNAAVKQKLGSLVRDCERKENDLMARERGTGGKKRVNCTYTRSDC